MDTRPGVRLVWEVSVRHQELEPDLFEGVRFFCVLIATILFYTHSTCFCNTEN